MELTQEKSGPVLILRPAGKLDDAASLELQRKLGELVDAGERRLVLDLAETVQIGAAGLRVLLSTSKKLEGIGGGLVLCTMSEAVKTAMDVAGIARQVATSASQAEAVKRLSADVEKEKVRNLALELLTKGEKKGDKPR